MGVDDFDDEAFLISIYISRFDRNGMNCTVSEASVDRVRERLSNFQLMSCGLVKWHESSSASDQ